MTYSVGDIVTFDKYPARGTYTVTRAGTGSYGNYVVLTIVHNVTGACIVCGADDVTLAN